MFPLAWLGLLTACTRAPVPVPTTQGLAEGVVSDGVVSFLGIEYARAKRWALPEPGPSWEGVRRFDRLGPACPQSGQTTMVEDCLFLNVFAPDAPPTPRPVLVWIHGGGLRAGQGGTDVGRLAREGLVVVSFNYRLGLLGFRDWPGWSEQDPRNFGQADMVAALRWVQANIAAFGGDPNQVTVAGHSAGGMGVQLMMVDPRARGLFHRAIAHAGYGTWPFPRAGHPSAEARAGLEPLETTASPETLVARVRHFHLPYVGGSDLREQPSATFLTGGQAPVPYLAGANSYDGHGTVDGAGIGVSGMRDRYGANPSVRRAYADDFAVSDEQAMARLFGDMRYVFASWVTVGAMEGIGQPGYLFYYDAPSTGLPGASHGAQYGAVFGSRPFALREAWVAFAKTGSPNPSGGTAWSPYTSADPTWRVFSPEPRTVVGAQEDKMQVIAGLTFPGLWYQGP